MQTNKTIVAGLKSGKDFSHRFDTEQKCLDYLVRKRWGDTPVCPYCGCKKVYKKNDGRYICSQCKRHSPYLLVRCSKVPNFRSSYGSELSTCWLTTSRESHPANWRANSKSHKRQRGLCCRKSESCYATKKTFFPTRWRA